MPALSGHQTVLGPWRSFSAQSALVALVVDMVVLMSSTGFADELLDVGYDGLAEAPGVDRRHDGALPAEVV